MSWKASGFGIRPFRGSKAPSVDVGYQDGKTVFIFVFDGELTMKQIEPLADDMYKLGKTFLEGTV